MSMILDRCRREAVVFLVATGVFSLFAHGDSVSNFVPVAGNSWVVNPSPDSSDGVSRRGDLRWESSRSIIRTYFKVTKPGDVKLAVRVGATQGSSQIRFVFNGKTNDVDFDEGPARIVSLGSFEGVNAGYHYLEMQGLKKEGRAFADITDAVVVADAPVFFVKDEFYWGRRGPSVHLQFAPPSDSGDILYLYSEITVPEGSDVPGSYYMANGFSVGYFGIQANSPDERRVLFSVWSPFKTDNPREIPEDQRVILLKKGPDVNAGNFGGEGSGGQSYRRFFWKAGVTYGFLLKGEPSENDSTDFTAWFFAPEIGRWELMASFRRPRTTTYLRGLHSFLENFRTDTGYISRSAFFSNQWVFSTDLKWREITEFAFSCDNTGHKRNRLDFTGGSDGKRFFLRNCGFFDADVKPGTRFKRDAGAGPPAIDFDRLP